MNISRRAFMGTVGAAVLSEAAFGRDFPGGTRKQPNVLFIITDQQSFWTLGQYGGQLPGTPNIDSIGRRGATFRNFFVTSAVCTPSRGCYMTGRFPHAHGAYHNGLPLNPDEFTLGHLFENAGYETGYAGKWHLDGKNDPTWPDWIPDSRSFGFQDHQWMYNQGHWKRIIERPTEWPDNRSVAMFGSQPYISPRPDGRPDEEYDVAKPGEYFTNWLADKAIEFIERPRQKSFFYVLSFPDPHQPYSVEDPYASMFAPKDMKLPVTFHQKNLPAWAAEKQKKEDLPSEGVTCPDDPRREEIFRKRKTQYLGEVKCIDDNVGRVLKTLSDRGLLQNTMIIFCSDHGDYMGEHGIYYKNNLYEPAHHVGMMMCWPGRIAPGTNVNQCVANVDLLPTLAGLLSLTTSGREQGRDASALLHGDAGNWEDVAFIHKDDFSQSGIFTESWELGLARDGDSVLFDRKNDLLQIHNLYHEPAHAAVVKELTARTIQHNRKVNCPALTWLEKL
ncbi:sulfatase [Edaphobacter acidisoli]|uniref:Sulfatase n=2 Tax=Edaphobacter acidisoli TaxID=2040573 RepID=A0A916RSQ0_9BACT|nr:sulfatase-like hydrolase/transferase [Edaphobacter acidisoli]GGA67176.1 sulfatase [Edaphobacter acidisoli]